MYKHTVKVECKVVKELEFITHSKDIDWNFILQMMKIDGRIMESTSVPIPAGVYFMGEEVKNK